MTPDPSSIERSADDSDIGWGEDPDGDPGEGPGGGSDAREAWLRAQRPPHHGD